MAEADRVTNYLWVASYDAGCSETDRGQTTGEEFWFQAIFKGKLLKKMLRIRKILYHILRVLFFKIHCFQLCKKIDTAME